MSTPTLPTLRIERILLLAWTVALAMVVALGIRSIPPSLAWALLPYLALVARHLIAPPVEKAEAPRPYPEEVFGEPAGIAGPKEATGPAKPMPVTATEPEATDPGPIPARPPAARSRRRPRPRLVPEPAPAAWVEVAPGRFVRGESPEPPPPPEGESTPSEPPGPVEPSEVASQSAGHPEE